MKRRKYLFLSLAKRLHNLPLEKELEEYNQDIRFILMPPNNLVFVINPILFQMMTQVTCLSWDYAVEATLPVRLRLLYSCLHLPFCYKQLLFMPRACFVLIFELNLCHLFVYCNFFYLNFLCFFMIFLMYLLSLSQSFNLGLQDFQ
jgi:hypothetical protein